MIPLHGVFKIAVVSTSLTPDGPIGKSDNEVTVQLKLGNQVSKVTGKGLELKWKDVFLFEQKQQQKLIITVFETQEDAVIGYAEVLLTPLIKIPETRHQITIHSVYRQANLAIQDKESAVIDIEVMYSEKFRSTLEIKVLQATLTRNTEAFGKMDPYVKLQIGDNTKHTTVKQQAGKYPKWQEEFQFYIINPSQILNLTVLDKDVVSSDIVGNATVYLRTEGYLIPSNEFINRDIPLIFEGQQSGILKIATRFSLQEKK